MDDTTARKDGYGTQANVPVYVYIDKHMWANLLVLRLRGVSAEVGIRPSSGTGCISVGGFPLCPARPVL